MGVAIVSGTWLYGAACSGFALAAMLWPILCLRRAGRLAASCCTFLAGACALGAALPTLGDHTGHQVRLFAILPGLPLTVNLTPLAAYFWLFVALLSLVTALTLPTFSSREGRHTGEAPRSIPSDEQPPWPGGTLTNLLLVVALVLPAAANVLVFALLWQLLLGLATALTARGRSGSDAGSPWAALGLLGLGSACLLAALLALGAGCNSLQFDALKSCGPQLHGAQPSLIFALTLAGWATVPAVIYRHQPNSGSERSAPTGAITTTLASLALYPLLLMSFVFLPAGPLWWGALTVLVGSIAALWGTLRAQAQAHLWSFLAGMAIAQHGAVAIALGAALMLRSGGNGAAAATALTAALLLALVFTTCRGALHLVGTWLQRAAGSVDRRRLGGLLSRMPWTGLYCLAILLAATIVPPLGGFAGIWLTLQALLTAARQAAQPGYGGIALAGDAALALMATLSLTGALTWFGIAFLGAPRSEGAASAREAAPPLQLALIALSGLSLAYGLPVGGVPAGLGTLAGSLAGTMPPTSWDIGWAALQQGSAATGHGSSGGSHVITYSFALLAALLCCMTVLLVCTRGISARYGTRRMPLWLNGAPPIESQVLRESLSQATPRSLDRLLAELVLGDEAAGRYAAKRGNVIRLLAAWRAGIATATRYSIRTARHTGTADLVWLVGAVLLLVLAR